jgi:hypothetical protein
MAFSGGKKPRESEKILFRGNELNNLVQAKDLGDFSAQNELIFECKRTPIEPQNAPKATFCAAWQPNFATCAREPQSGYTSLESGGERLVSHLWGSSPQSQSPVRQAPYENLLEQTGNVDENKGQGQKVVRAW